MVLTPAQRNRLRAQAHRLSAVVTIGDKGLTDSVVAEADRALQAHELIKLKANTNDRAERASWMEQLCARLDALAVQSIGKILVIWRERPGNAESKETALPRTPPRNARASKTTRTSRPRSPVASPRPASEPRRRRPRTSR